MSAILRRGSGVSEFLEYLVRYGILTPEAASRARSACASTAQSVDVVLVELGLVHEAELARHVGDFFGLPHPDSGYPDPDMDLVEALGLRFCREQLLLPLSLSGDRLLLAVADPFETTAADTVAFRLERACELRVFPRSAIAAWFQRSEGADGAHREAGSWTDEADVDRLRESASEAPVIRFVAQMFQQAVDRGATDIHIEPRSDCAAIRLRCDGMLETVERVPKSQLAGISTRLKILANLNIAERRRPQDGRIRLTVRGVERDVRVSVIPTVHGESFVLRLLLQNGSELTLSALGYDAAAEAQLAALSHLPNGIVLVTGPTGSGKTTTLYAVLRERLGDAVKIFTVEDPVEYRLDGMTQLQVDPAVDLGFSSALRSVLRHDPDIILVGEIRDVETARIAIQAALTGHLVFATLHTNSAAGALTRLLDMGLDAYLIGATTRAVLAQRLLRRVCPECGGEGCAACRSSGLSGRTVTYEILPVDRDMARAIVSGASEADLERLALSRGMTPMIDHALGLAERGVTTRREVRRVLNIEGGTGDGDRV